MPVFFCFLFCFVFVCCCCCCVSFFVCLFVCFVLFFFGFCFFPEDRNRCSGTGKGLEMAGLVPELYLQCECSPPFPFPPCFASGCFASGLNKYLWTSRGSTQICSAGVYMMHEQKFWNSTPKHILCKIHPLNKDFVGFCFKFDPLDRFESKEFEQILTKPPLFPETRHFSPLLCFTRSTSFYCKKDTFSLVFVHACAHQYNWVPPGVNPRLWTSLKSKGALAHFQVFNKKKLRFLYQ